MLPILVSFGPVRIYSYGLLLLLALFVGLYWWWKIGRDEHWDETKLFDIFFVAVFTYFVFGRIGYVLTHPDLQNFVNALGMLAHPGISVSVGAIASVVVVIVLAKRHDWEGWKVADAVAVVLATIMVIGSLGAILNGSNPGIVSEWGIVHPGQTEKRIPVDVLAFVWSLVTFGVVSRVRKNFRFYSWYKGEASVAKEGLAALTFGLLLGIYWLSSGFVDDGVRIYGVAVLSLVGLAIGVVAGCMIYLRSGKNRGEELLAKLRRKRT